MALKSLTCELGVTSGVLHTKWVCALTETESAIAKTRRKYFMSDQFIYLLLLSKDTIAQIDGKKIIYGDDETG